MIKAVLFDMDGVLIPETSAQHQAAFFEAIYEVTGIHLTLKNLSEIRKFSTHQKIEWIRKNILQINNEEEWKIKELKKEYVRDKLDVIKKSGYFISPMHKLIDHGYKCGIVTNASLETVEHWVDDTVKQLTTIVTSDYVKNPKPSFEIYLNAMIKIGVPPTECLIVEDNVNGLEAAEKTGASVLRYSFNTDQTAEEAVMEYLYKGRFDRK